MAAYSLDLRKRVLRAWDSGMKPKAIVTTFDVSVRLGLSVGAAPSGDGIHRPAEANHVSQARPLER